MIAAALMTDSPVIVRPAAASGPLPVRPDLIQNGSFETPTVPVDVTFRDPTSLDRWSIVPDVPGTPVRVQRPTFEPVPDGAQLLERNVSPSNGIRQRFATIPGTVYEITLAYAATPGPSIAETFLAVTWDGVTIGGFSAGGRSPSALEWRPGSMLVRATGDTSELELVAHGTSGSSNMVIDTVAVRGALCQTTHAGGWGDASIWSCAGIQQVPGPGNYDVINHPVDTTAVPGAIAAAQVVLTGQGTLLARRWTSPGHCNSASRPRLLNPQSRRWVAWTSAVVRDAALDTTAVTVTPRPAWP
jgi:hypothetical protein